MIRVATFLSLLTASVLYAQTSDTKQTVNLDWTEYRSLSNNQLTNATGGWTVVCFLGTECPLARLYGPRLNALATEFKSQGVQFIGVVSNTQDSEADIREYVSQHQIEFPMIHNPDQSLAVLFKATRTPEVFVLNDSGRIFYRGRIDDQYVPGIARQKPLNHDLRDAIKAILADKPVPQPVTTAVGCLITFVRPHKLAEGEEIVTFSRDVAPILNQHCVECHRAGEIGPFELTEYKEVVGWSEMILEVTHEGRMPPWHADPRFGRFLGERSLPNADMETLVAWVKQGMPQGNSADLPPRPTKTEGWHLDSAPDVEFAMRDRAFPVPAEGIVEYQYFVVDPQWKEDRWIRAAQVIPGNAEVVHHSIIFVRAPDGTSSSGIGWLGAYVPGQRTTLLPPGHARKIPAGSKLVFQMHYTPNGRETEDRTRVGVWFSKTEDVTHEVLTRVALNHDFEIPPNARNYEVKIQLAGFSRDSRLLSATPHMHLRGKSFQLQARRGAEDETLLFVPRYDFNWQHRYQFASSVALDTVEALEMTISFDNSPENPTNPAPNDYVTWGDQTGEEMAVAFFEVAHPIGQPRIANRQNGETDRNQSEREHQIRIRVDEFLKTMDPNRDGVVARDEAPITFRKFGFSRMDADGNGRLERAEIEAAAAKRP